MSRLDDIQNLLDGIEERLGVRILYAVESGSRAWGFASPDSDYDIRFIYAWPQCEYSKIGEVRDTIELPIKDDLDAGGWDVRKALSLLKKSNGPLVEWLHSPMVYRAEEGFLDEWRRVLGEVFSPYAQVCHYRGLARQMWMGSLQGESVKAKSYLYCLRATACAEWVLQRQTPPPVEFSEVRKVLPDRLTSELEQMLEAKAQSGEKDAGRRYEVIDAYLSEKCSENGGLEELSKPPKEASVLDELYVKTISKPRLPELLFKESYTLDRVRKKDMLIFEAVAGSKAFGTNVEGSDEDLRGIFIAPPLFHGGLDQIQQVQDTKGDEVYFELGRVVDLLISNNPNLMELLAMPEDCIRCRHPVMDLLKPELFLSKRCEQSFGGYALGQIKKARGLNKKVMNPEPEQRKTLSDFCYVLDGQGSRPLMEWLDEQGVDQADCGLVAVNHSPGTYALFHDSEIHYRGIFSPRDPDAVLCSSVPREAKPVAWVSVNEDAFKAHCKNHEAYWKWVKNRNEQRYLTNAQHDKGYDSKNMMHTLRLLDMAEEIATEGVIRVRRPNREFLLNVRSGAYEYNELLAMAEDKMQRISEAYAKCSLPEEVDRAKAVELLAEMRSVFQR